MNLYRMLLILLLPQLTINPNFYDAFTPPLQAANDKLMYQLIHNVQRFKPKNSDHGSSYHVLQLREFHRRRVAEEDAQQTAILDTALRLCKKSSSTC